MKLETKRQAAWSWTGTVGFCGSSSADEAEESEQAGESSRLSSDPGEPDEDEEGQFGGSTVGVFATGFLTAFLALLSVAWVSLRCTMSNSSR